MIFLRQNDFIGQLLVEETFLEFDGPRLFIASDAAGQKFIINCLDSDVEGDSWLAAAISERRLSILKDGALHLRDVFTYPELTILKRFVTEPGGQLIRGESVAPAQLSEEDLPDPGVSLPTSSELSPAVSAPFLARTLNANVVLLRLFPHTSKHEAPADSVGGILSSFSKYLSDRVERPFRQALHSMADALQWPEVNLVGTFASSLGVEFAVRGDNELVREALQAVIRELTDAGNVSNDDSQLLDSPDSLPMSKFLARLSAAGSDLSVEAASRDDEYPAVASLPLHKVKGAVKTLKATRKQLQLASANVLALADGEPEFRTLEVELVGLSLQSKTFEMRSLETNEYFRGTIAADLFNDVSRAELPSLYRVVIQGTKQSDEHTLASLGKLSLISATKMF